MKTLKTKVQKYLENQPLFRERKNKDRGIVNLLIERYKPLSDAIESGMMSKDEVTAIVRDYASMDRSWRQILEHTPELRGSDYDEKTKLESEKLEELGYATTKHI